MKDRALRVFPWAERAGVREGTLRAFLSGKSRSMRHETLEKLARAENATVGELIGEKPLDRPANRDIVAIKGLKVEAALGGGMEVSDESEGEPFFFRKSWVEREVGKDGAQLRVITLRGDSMEPTLSDGDVALIRLSDSRMASDAGVYCLWDGNGLVVKRVERLPGRDSRLRLISDNPLYQPYEAALDEVKVIGRVIWRAGRV